MKFKPFFFLSFSFLIGSTVFSQAQNWSHTYSEEKVIIENIGQFKISSSGTLVKDIKYSFDGENEDFYFTTSGVIMEFTTKEKRKKSEEEKAARKAKKQAGFASAEEFREFEREGEKPLIKRDVLESQWLNANSDVKIIPEEKTPFYHNYGYYDDNNVKQFAGQIQSYYKITYKNLYDNIDVVYEIHPESGLKYSVVVHPGGDISKVKLKYSKNIKLNSDGTIHTATKFGDVIDHSPITFFEKDKSKFVKSTYLVNGNTIGFSVDSYDINQTIVIDPWTQSPTFASDWDCIWECERDGAGNVYIIGGILPLQIKKYNSIGTIQWTYNTPYDTTNCWLGTFAVDNLGNSYVTAGSSAQIQKVSTAGTLVWDNPSPGGLLGLTEFWNITFNCDQTKLVIAGTDGFVFEGPLPYIFDIDMNNGNVTNSVQVTEGGFLSFPPDDQEVRSIIPCNNSKYYFITHDSIGYIHQSLTTCIPGELPFHVSSGLNLGYKCENYRYDNSGIMALAHYNGFIFVHKGNEIQKRDFTTANVLATVAIPGGSFTNSFVGNQVSNSGIEVDDCGNIYVGSTTGVYKFDQSLVQTGFFPTTFNVYDVEVNSGGEVIACGSTGNSGQSVRSGSIQSFAAAACAPQAITCCDATFCVGDPACTTDTPFSFTPTTSGGTWSASCGACINSSTGQFNPATAGAGTHTITYTLPSCVETMEIDVYVCPPMSVCLETNGTMTVSGGVPGYDWSEYLPAGTTPITNESECTSCDPSYSWNIFINSCMDAVFPVSECTITAGYYPLGSGTNMTPGSNFPIQVVDITGQTVTINSTGSLPACTACPTITVTTSSQVNVNCFGQSTGSFSASSSGGTGPYDYTLLLGASTISSFSNVAGAQAFSNLAAGTYTLNVTDNGGCTGTTTITITSNPAITVTQSSITPASCGASNGSVTVSGSGGSGTITYSWNTNPVQTGATATGLSAGPYIVTATDALGCTQTLNVTMTSSGGISASITNPVNPTCNNGTNGTATASVTGGTGTITYSWSPSGGSAATGTGLSGGILYTVTVTDANSCSATATVTLTNPTAITVTTSSTDATCGASDGSLSASGSGGTGTLDYSWNTSPVQNTPNAAGVPSGNYTVTVTDDNGCTATANESVNNTGAPTITLVSQTDLDCNGDTDGTATVSASGGNGALTITWNTSPAQTGTTATNLGGGTHIATVTDASGCSASLNVTIVEPSAVSGVATSTNSSCSASTGTATVVASGGDGSYTYLWSNNGTSSTISNLAPGTYSVIITDGNGCTGSASTSVATVTSANIDAGLDVIIVSGTSTTLTATGGITYLWTPSDSLSCTNCSNPVANPSVTTTYYVTGTDANGCVGTDSVRVIVEAPCGEVWVPTAFSPNGDGNNEQICVYGGCITSMTFQLFDRWGNVVFETNDNAICWDGIYKGKQMNTAVFAYYLYVVLDNGDVVEKKGNITLVR